MVPSGDIPVVAMELVAILSLDHVRCDITTSGDVCCDVTILNLI